MKTVDLIAGARPNFMKIAPIFYAMKESGWCRPRIIHTGQHYSDELWKVFLNDFGIAEPFANLNAIPPGSSLGRLEQAERVNEAYQLFCEEHRPDFVVVVGDVNSTLGAARAAKALGIGCGHVEAGLRSFDLTMPEELNRIETDQLVQILWTPSADGNENLSKERVPGRVEMVGNVMIDAFVMLEKQIREEAKKYVASPFCLVTLHRPANVDNPDRLEKLVSVLEEVSRRIKVSFPIHPRTKKRLEETGIFDRLAKSKNIELKDPQPYIRFMGEVCQAKFLITDSGGVQEESTFLKIPCLTVRENTERPITVSIGSNDLIPPDGVPEVLLSKVDAILRGSWNKQPGIPPLWDGKAAGRIATSLRDYLGA